MPFYFQSKIRQQADQSVLQMINNLLSRSYSAEAYLCNTEIGSDVF